MKVYYNGFNLHRQFPNSQNIVENFIDHVYEDAEKIEVSYYYAVLLVADTINLFGAKNGTLTAGEKVKQICCNEDKVLVLLENGDLLKVTESVNKVPKPIHLDDEDRIVQISSGSKLTVALTLNGALFNFPNKLEFDGSEIVEVKTGREHCVLLDKNGNVFSFGRGSRGQLGHGTLEDEAEPKFVEALGGIRIQAIEAGGWHSCALSKDGDLYVWGWNGNGQLGLSEREDSGENVVAIMATPQVLDVDFTITTFGCGSKHTVVVTDEGKLYGCGWNKYKQLKSGACDNVYKMIYLGDFSKEVIKDIRCGPWNTLLVCEG